MNQINADSLTSLSLSSIRPTTASQTVLESDTHYPARIALGPTPDVALLKIANQATVALPVAALPATVKELVLSVQAAALPTVSVNSTSASNSAAPVTAQATMTTASTIPLSIALQSNAAGMQLQLNSLAGVQLSTSQQLGLLQQLSGSTTRRQPWDITLRRAEQKSPQVTESTPQHSTEAVVLRLQASPQQLTVSLLDAGKPQPLSSAMQRQWLGEVMHQLGVSHLKWQQLPTELKQLLQQQLPQLRHLPDHATIRLGLTDDASAVSLRLEQPEHLSLTPQQQQQLGFKVQNNPAPAQGRVELSAQAKAAMAKELQAPSTGESVHPTATSKLEISDTTKPLSTNAAAANKGREDTTARSALAILQTPPAPKAEAGTELVDIPQSELAKPSRHTSLVGIHTARQQPAAAAEKLSSPLGEASTDAHSAITRMTPSSTAASFADIDLAALAAQWSKNAIPAPKIALPAQAQQLVNLVQGLPSSVFTEAQLQQELNAGLMFHPLQSTQNNASHAGGLAIAIQLLLGRLGVLIPDSKPTEKQQRLKEQVLALDTQQAEAALKQLSSQAGLYQTAQLETVSMQKAETPGWMLCLPLPFAEQLQYGHCQIEQRQARRANGEPASLWHLTLSLEIPNHGALVIEAALGPEHNKLQFYTPSEHLMRTIERFGAILRDRLKLQGVPISSFDCTLGEIPHHLQRRGSSLLQVKV